MEEELSTFGESPEWRKTDTDPKLVRRAKIFSAAVSSAVFLIGVLVLIGWEFNLAVLKSVSANFVTMKPNTAIGLIFLGTALWFLQEKRLKHWTRYFGYGSAVAAILIGAMTIFEYFSGFNLGIDSLFFTETAPALFTIFPGRMALNTAFVFVFLGVSLLSFNIKTKRDLCLGSLTALLSGAVSLLVIIGYLYNVSEFYFVRMFYTPMALHTAAAFFLISLGILFAWPESKLTKVFVRSDSVGITARRLLPLVFIAPFGLSLLEWFGIRFNLYNREFGHALVSTVSVAILVFLVWLNAIQMERKEIERAQTQELLIKSMEEARMMTFLVEHTEEAVALVDFEGDNVLRYVNHAWEKLFGYSKQEVENIMEPLLVEAVKRDPILYKKFKENVDSHMLFSAEMEWRKKDGALIWIEVFSSPSRDVHTGKYIWLNTIHDISARKLAETRILKEKEISLASVKELEKFKLAVDGASDHIIITDQDSKILYANKAAEIVSGYTQKEMLGKIPGKLWGGRMPNEFYANMWNVIKNKKQPFVADVTNRRKNGQDYIAEVHISPILDKNNQVHFFVGIERDITKMKDVEKLRNEFVSITSHQLRTPLTAIKWHLELLFETKLPRKEKHILHQVFLSNERMISLINDLLDVSRIEEGKKFVVVPQKVDVVPLIKELISDYAAAARENKLIIKLDKSLPKKLELLIDGDKIRQVFQNLVDNAIKYSLPGGEIDIGYQSATDSATFYVKDNGVGVPQNQQDRIFQKFFRADNVLKLKNQGTGLGLYIVKAIVESHGGKIWFESKENKGTTFYFSLPIGK